MIKIGVFDSGIGGLSVVNAIKESLPNTEVVFKNDSQNVPYGNKSVQILKPLVAPILNELVKEGCKVIVIACNTITTTMIEELRREISVPLIGMEPMVKPAAQNTKSKIITVCATPTTLASKRYAQLKNEFAKDVKVLEPDCSDWSYMIENNQVDRIKIEKLINQTCDEGSDTIVLGCTHYHWIEDLIKQTAEQRAQVLQPEQPVIAQLKRVLQQLY